MGAWGAMYLMQACKERWPRIGNLSLISIAVGSGMFMDWAAEHTMISFQLISYLSTIPSLSLCAGTIYQFPLYEAVFFGGVVGFSGACHLALPELRGSERALRLVLERALAEASRHG
jgi:hypothetical protein